MGRRGGERPQTWLRFGWLSHGFIATSVLVGGGSGHRRLGPWCVAFETTFLSSHFPDESPALGLLPWNTLDSLSDAKPYGRGPRSLVSEVTLPVWKEQFNPSLYRAPRPREATGSARCLMGGRRPVGRAWPGAPELCNITAMGHRGPGPAENYSTRPRGRASLRPGAGKTGVKNRIEQPGSNLAQGNRKQ